MNKKYPEERSSGGSVVFGEKEKSFPLNNFN